MMDHHLQLNLAKTELLVVSANSSFHHNFTFQLGPSNITKTARNLGVVIDDKLNFSDHITKNARSCRFALYNIKKIRLFLSEHATQLLQSLALRPSPNWFRRVMTPIPSQFCKKHSTSPVTHGLSVCEFRASEQRIFLIIMVLWSRVKHEGSKMGT